MCEAMWSRSAFLIVAVVLLFARCVSCEEENPFFGVPFTIVGGMTSVQNICRVRCREHTPRSYPAWVLSPAENAQLGACIPTATVLASAHVSGPIANRYAVLGGNSLDNNNYFRWNEKPVLNTSNDFKGPYVARRSSLLCMQGPLAGDCPWAPGEPNNAGEQQIGAVYVSGVYQGWNDGSAVTSAPMYSFCICRKLPPATPTPTSTPSSSMDSLTASYSSPSTLSASNGMPLTSLTTTQSCSTAATATETLTVSVVSNSSGQGSATLSGQRSATISARGSGTLTLSEGGASISRSYSDALSSSSESRMTPTTSTSPALSLSLTQSLTVPTATRSVCRVVADDQPQLLFAELAFDNTTMTASFIARPQAAGADVNHTGETAYFLVFTMPKSIALRQAVLNMSLVLRTELYVEQERLGERLAMGSNSLAAWGTASRSVIDLRMAPSGSQFVSTSASVELPLSVLDGVCVEGRRTARIDVVLLPTVIKSMEAATSVAAVVGPLSVATASPATAVAVTRLAILQALMSCETDDTENDGNSLLGLAVGPTRGAYMRGAVVGNITIVVAFAAAAALLVLAFAVYGSVMLGMPLRLSLNALQEVFHVPGVLMLPIAAVCQPTLTACVQLIALQPVPGDRVFGILGALFVTCLLMVPFTVAIARSFCLVLVPSGRKPEIDPAGEHTGEGVPRSVRRVVRRLLIIFFLDRARWKPLHAEVTTVAWKRRFGPIFLDSGTWWYPLLDMWLAAAVGVVGGLTLGLAPVCRSQLAFIGIAYLIGTLLQLFIVVPLVLATKIYFVLVQGLGVISSIAIMVSIVQDVNEETMSVTVATNAMLLIAVLSTLKSLADVGVLFLALPSHMRKAVAVLHRPIAASNVAEDEAGSEELESLSLGDDVAEDEVQEVNEEEVPAENGEELLYDAAVLQLSTAVGEVAATPDEIDNDAVRDPMLSYYTPIVAAPDPVDVVSVEDHNAVIAALGLDSAQFSMTSHHAQQQCSNSCSDASPDVSHELKSVTTTVSCTSEGSGTHSN